MSVTATNDQVPPAPRSQGARVTVDGLTVEYATATGSIRALDDVSLMLEPGSSTAVVGPSGCGKSTLLGVIGGLEAPTAGVVTVGDNIITSMSDAERTDLRRRAFGFVFQADNLQPFLTVAENVAVQRALAEVDDDPVAQRELLEALDVATLGHRFPDQMSMGQRQRTAVARALVHRPRLVLADEPTGSLDAASSGRVVELLLQLQRRHGTTLVVVTHDRSVADHMDVVVKLRDGRVTATTGEER
jgi:ABC-type lipoprotein export system ATPase subunit